VPLREPLTEATARRWREEVRRAVDLRTSRRSPGCLLVGNPGELSLASQPPPRQVLDPALRCDLLDALLQRWSEAPPDQRGPRGPALWWRRPGVPERHDDDVAWLGAARHVFAARSLRRTFVVVTRVGWYDPETGVGQRWARVRRR